MSLQRRLQLYIPSPAEERSERVLVTSNCAFRTTDLVICDGLGYILDKTIQQSGMILQSVDRKSVV